MLTTGKYSWISNCSIGLAAAAMTAEIPFNVLDPRPALARAILGFGQHAGLAHQVDDACDEAEQHEHNEPPRPDAEPVVECVSDCTPDHHAPHQLGGQAQGARHPRTIGTRAGIGGRFGWLARPNLVEPLAKTPQPRGEINLVGGPAVRIVFSARVVAHFRHPRANPSSNFRPLKARGPY